MVINILGLKFNNSEPNIHSRDNKPIYLEHADQLVDTNKLSQENNINPSSLIKDDLFTFNDSQNNSQSSLGFTLSQAFAPFSDSQTF